MVTRKSRREIEKMRHAGRIVAEVLALVESELRPGVSTGHLDRLAERHIRSAGAVPSFKGYGHRSNPFPASLCISVDGEAAVEVTELVDTTRLAMMAGIAAAVPGANLGDISGAIEDAATPGGYGIVRQFVGHGIGTEM